MSTLQTVSSEEARRCFSDLIASAFYSGRQTAITKNRQPIAWIVGQPFMQVLHAFIDYMEQENPGLADTLAIYLNEHVRKEIKQAEAEIERGEIFPFESILDAQVG